MMLAIDGVDRNDMLMNNSGCGLGFTGETTTCGRLHSQAFRSPR